MIIVNEREVIKSANSKTGKFILLLCQGIWNPLYLLLFAPKALLIFGDITTLGYLEKAFKAYLYTHCQINAYNIALAI